MCHGLPSIPAISLHQTFRSTSTLHPQACSINRIYLLGLLPLSCPDKLSSNINSLAISCLKMKNAPCLRRRLRSSAPISLPATLCPRIADSKTAEEQFRDIQAEIRESVGRANIDSGSTETAKASPSPPKQKLDVASSSSLSSASQPPSPTTGHLTDELKSPRKSRASSSSSLDSHQPPPAASIAQYQTFGPDPTTFDDPTIYHIRPVTDDMTDEEKAEIFSVAQFPHNDVSHLIAGTIPDKDFSNAKPSNQVNANTFQAYIEPYLRPLTEEDMAFLKERVSPLRPPFEGQADQSRAIDQRHSSCHAEESVTTPKSGPKKTVSSRSTVPSTAEKSCHPINLAATSNR